MIEQIAETTLQNLMPTGDKVEIGDLTSKDFKPHLKLNRWGGECFIKVGLPVTEKSLPIVDGDRITWEGRDRHVLMYPLAPDNQMKLGGYEYEIVFDKKPRSNKIEIDLQSQGLKFYYQPELTSQEIEEGCVRPDNVVGGYAVYHATKGGMVSPQDVAKGITTGQGFFIFRPRIVNAIGQWMWEEQVIADDKQIITIPQEILEGGHYPLRHVAGDTFGYTTDGSSVLTLSADILRGVKGTGAAGTGVSISVFARDSGDNVKGVLLNHTEETLVDNGVTNPVALATDVAWKTATFSTGPTILAQDYWVCIVAESQIGLFYNAGSAGDGALDNTNSYTTPEAPGDFPKYAILCCIYCTYTPGGGAAAYIPRVIMF